ncbi:MAG: hypothetical protein CMI05_00445 [Oceanospirillaceae bacterium]|nr:hypothetical protein [Oceanospirillaceae bacterium]|tara:strand:+ start:71 stop:604 length:534 start_codon:yes stop_codon:yes gene_type:complete
MKQIDIRTRSVKSLESLLKSSVSEPGAFTDKTEYLAALRSQRKLAAYSDDELGIQPCALNTLKAHADHALDQGYQGLDQLRIAAIEAIENAVESHKQSNKSTKRGALNLLKQKEAELDLLRQQNIHLVYICQELKRLAQLYASSGDDTLKAICDKDMKRINTLLSISSPIDVSNDRG